MGKPRLSPTAFNTWQNCQRSYLYKYLDKKPTKPQSAHLSLGNSIHAVLRDFISPIDQQPSIDSLLNRHWQSSGYRDAEMEMQVRKVARVWLEQYVLNEGDVQTRAVEKDIAYDMGEFELFGRIDRIDIRESETGTELVIVDYKTGSTPDTDDDAKASMAMAFYAAATQSSYGITCQQVELHHVPSGRRAKAVHTKDSLLRMRDRMLSLGSDVLEARTAFETLPIHDRETFFPATISGLCRWCDFQSFCTEGQQAGEPVAPWQGVLDVVAEAESLDD
ncbi:MAG: hypothetical protein RIS75_147 [Actinomycetota bacterium]